MGRVQPTTTSGGQKFTRQEFPKPESFVVEGKEPEEMPPAKQVETGQGHIRGPATNVRLRSSRTIVNNKHLPAFVKYKMSQQPLQKEIDDYIAQAEIDGFSVGSLVARRWGTTRNWEIPQMWGMILVVRDVHMNIAEPYAPFMVKWITNSELESAWKEDLFCMVPAMDEGLIWGIVEAQGFNIGAHSADGGDT